MAQRQINLCSGNGKSHIAAAGYSGEIKILENESNCVLIQTFFSANTSVALHHVREAPCRNSEVTVVINDRTYCATEQGYHPLAIVFTNEHGNIVFNLIQGSRYETSIYYYIGKLTKYKPHY